jgi:hypothetical protein
MPKGDTVKELGKSVGSPVLAAVVVLAGYAFTYGREDAMQQAQVNQNTVVLVEIKEAVEALTVVVEGLSSQNLLLQTELDSMNRRAATRWTNQDQKIWSLQLQIANPEIEVPDSDDVVRGRDMP